MNTTQWTAAKCTEFISDPITGTETNAELTALAQDALEWMQEQEADNEGSAPADRPEGEWTIEAALPLAVAHLTEQRDNLA